MRDILSFLALLGLCFVGACSPTLPDANTNFTTDSTPRSNRTEAAFSFEHAQRISEIAHQRGSAIQAATTTLTKHAEGRAKDEDQVRRAAEALAELRADDDLAIRALVANLDFMPSIIEGGEPGPLEGYYAARALRAIGGSKVIDEIIPALRWKKSKQEQLIIAHLLVSCDSVEVTKYRVEKAIETERGRDDADRKYIGRLEAAKRWLDQPELLRDRKNWPSGM